MESTRANADNSFDLTVTTALVTGNSVKVYYTKDNTKPVEDEAGNELASVTESNAVTATETADKTVAISVVATDDRINATEDNSAVTVRGTSTGLANGTTITVGLDGSGTDVSGLTGTTNASGAWSVSVSATQIQGLDASPRRRRAGR